MKTRNIILFFIGLLVFCSCDDMFEPTDENTRQEDAMYQESTYANGLLMYGYGCLSELYLNSTVTDIATDDAVTNDQNSNLLRLATGTWSSIESPSPINQWDRCLGGVQYVNKFLSLVDKVGWTPSSKSKQKMYIDRLSGEAYALRAMFYYFLLQSHAGYADDGELYGAPLFTEPLDPGSDFNMPRATFKACVDRIYEDCDSAMNLLPMDYANIQSADEIPDKYRKKPVEAELSGYNRVFGNTEKGRISARMAQFVKAQTALLAASPAYTVKASDSEKVALSEEAALLCAKVIKDNGGMAGFDETGNLDWWSSTYKNLIESTSPEVLWRYDRDDTTTPERNNFPPSLYGNGRVNPSQNLVDAFPMNNGLPISDPNSGYDPQDPYKNRDNRLANTVVYNGAKFHGQNILTGENMAYGKQGDEFDDNIGFNSTRSTRTGYYLKKLLREDVSANPNSQAKQKHIYPRMRYTEIFLAYAEAANDAWGPSADPKGVGFTAFDVIQKIRERAGIGKDEFGRDVPGGDQYISQCTNDKSKMAELIKNERRLELCFENKRFWDLRRWLLPLNETVKGMKVTRIDPEDEKSALNYEVINVEDRVFKDYQHYGPIPNGEILKWDQLKQNTGW